MMLPDLKSIHVNREKEVALLLEMIRGTRQAHILLIKADGGIGKSSLLREFWRHGQETQRVSSIDLKGLDGSWTVLGKLADQLGREYFEHFDSKSAEFASTGGVTIDRSTLVGTQVKANVAPIDLEQRKMRSQLLAKAFFEDLDAMHTRYSQGMLFLFDTFDQAVPEVQEWLGGTFLNWVRRYRWLVTVIVGRSIPEREISWEELCLIHPLGSLDRDYVREYVQRVELSLSEEEIGVIYDITDGNPLDLATNIGRLLAKRGAING